MTNQPLGSRAERLGVGWAEQVDSRHRAELSCREPAGRILLEDEGWAVSVQGLQPRGIPGNATNGGSVMTARSSVHCCCAGCLGMGVVFGLLAGQNWRRSWAGANWDRRPRLLLPLRLPVRLPVLRSVLLSVSTEGLCRPGPGLRLSEPRSGLCPAFHGLPTATDFNHSATAASAAGLPILRSRTDPSTVAPALDGLQSTSDHHPATAAGPAVGPVSLGATCYQIAAAFGSQIGSVSLGTTC